MVEQQRWLEWLAARSLDDGVSGFDAGGWPDATWVLHSIYEDLGSTSDATWDDVHRERLAAGLDAPLVIGSLNLAERSTVIGGAVGMSDLRSGRSRVLWREMASRLSIELGTIEVPPCFRWFPHRSWPARVDPPDEGSLDRESLDALIGVLAAWTGTPSSLCLAYYSPLANRSNFDETWMREIAITDVPSLVAGSGGRLGTPSNWWAPDSTWMVFTDWDLWATKVSGPRDLIAEVERDPRLECIRWEPSPTTR